MTIIKFQTRREKFSNQCEKCVFSKCNIEFMCKNCKCVENSTLNCKCYLEPGKKEKKCYYYRKDRRYIEIR